VLRLVRNWATLQWLTLCMQQTGVMAIVNLAWTYEQPSNPNVDTCRVRRALENTCKPLGGGADAALTYGRGLMQVWWHSASVATELDRPLQRSLCNKQQCITTDGHPPNISLLQTHHLHLLEFGMHV